MWQPTAGPGWGQPKKLERAMDFLGGAGEPDLRGAVVLDAETAERLEFTNGGCIRASQMDLTFDAAAALDAELKRPVWPTAGKRGPGFGQ